MKLLGTLTDCGTQMEPLAAIEKLMTADRTADAYALLGEILLADDSPGMLVAAARVAGRCGRPLEAVDLLDRAIVADPSSVEAHRRQFETLVSDECRLAVGALLAQQPDLGPRLDEKVRRAFDRIEPSGSRFALEQTYVEHLMWRGQEKEAAAFIYPRLFERPAKASAQKSAVAPQAQPAGARPDGFLWWKFDLRFSYVLALLAAGNRLRAAGNAAGARFRASARRELDAIRGALLETHQHRRFGERQRAVWFRRAEELESLLAAAGLPAGRKP